MNIPLRALLLAIAGGSAMAAAIGIGRFFYTPVLPGMMAALNWTASTAGFVATANFIGYLLGALVASANIISRRPGSWLLVGLTLSCGSTFLVGFTTQAFVMMSLRFIGGLASAIVIVCASALVSENSPPPNRHLLTSVHFSGVGIGVVVSTLLIACLEAISASWSTMWVAGGLLAFASLPLVSWVVADVNLKVKVHAEGTKSLSLSARLFPLVVAYGLFGFGHVITATFLVTIIRASEDARVLELWSWTLFGLSAIPSAPLWMIAGQRYGLMRAFAIASMIQAAAIILSSESAFWLMAPIVALCLGSTVMGLTVLGLMGARGLERANPGRALAIMTASFALGQMLGPAFAGVAVDHFGGFRVPSLVAAAALVVAASLVTWRLGGDGLRK